MLAWVSRQICWLESRLKVLLQQKSRNSPRKGPGQAAYAQASKLIELMKHSLQAEKPLFQAIRFFGRFILKVPLNLRIVNGLPSLHNERKFFHNLRRRAWV